MESTTAAGYLASFTNNLERGIPVIIIFGQHYQHCSTVLNYRYNVAAVFHITNIWATKVGEEVVYRIRYEKENLSSKSWWAVAASPMPLSDRDFSQKAITQSCISCGKSYPQIYTCGWMCMNDQCQQFPKLDSLPGLNPAFLAERSDHTGKPQAPFPITPVLPQHDPDRPFDSYHLARGIVCPECNGCCSRISWYGYECGYVCDSAGCGYKHSIPHTPVSHTYFFGRLQHEAIGHPMPVDQYCFPITERSSICEGDFRTTTFDLMPGNFVVHAQGNATATAAPRGPNEIFLGLQTTKRMPLERRLKDVTRNNQREFTNHFAANFGMPYSYSAKAAHLSVAFSNAPDPVIAALGRLIWAGKRVLPNGAFDDKLNELLLCGYMNDNSMGWHDDGEEGLGITVVTLSLGGMATMHFRMKKKYFTPAALANKEQKINRYDPKRNVPVGSKLWEKRTALNAEFGKIPDAEWEKAKREVFKEFATVKAVQCKKLLEIELKHGDYLIMHGGEIQKYYEVCFLAFFPHALHSLFPSPSLSRLYPTAHNSTLPRLRTQYSNSPIFHQRSSHDFPKS